MSYPSFKTLHLKNQNPFVFNRIFFYKNSKDLIQGKLFQKCTHLLYCSVLGDNVSTRQMLQPDMGSIFHINIGWNILVIENYYVNYQNYQNSMLLTSSDTIRTLRHLFLFAQRELVSICTQIIGNCNQLSLHYNLEK